MLYKLLETNIIHGKNILGLLFIDSNTPEKTENKMSVEQSLNDSVFLPLYMCFLKCTQNAVMNKQLFYRLLDILLEQMFPELQTQNLQNKYDV